MNRKAAYSVFFGIIALVLMASLVSFSTSIAQEQKTGAYRQMTMETKKIAQNMLLVLDKTMNDAIADSIFQNNCTASPPGIKQNIEQYFQAIGWQFANAGKPELAQCILTINGITESSGNYTADISTQCSHDLAGEFSISYAMDRIFQRTATATLNSTTNQCTVTVYDSSASPPVTELSKEQPLP